MDQHKLMLNSEDYKTEVDEYLRHAYDTLFEPQHIREKADPLEETVAMHVKRNELLLKEPQVHNGNDQLASLHAQLLRTIREKRVNKFQNRADEMRDNIRQLFEINSQLQSVLNQIRNEVQRPTPDLFINTKDFHDESYARFLEGLAKTKELGEED